VPPVEVKAQGVCIDFNDLAMRGSGVDDRVDPEGIGFPGQQETARGVGEDSGEGIGQGPADPPGHVFLGHLEVGMDGGDDEIEGSQDFLVVIQAAVREDIRLYALEDMKGAAVAPIDAVDFLMLLPHGLRDQAAGIGGRLTVIADADISVTTPAGLRGQGLDAVRAVAVAGVDVQYSFYIP